MTIRNPTQYRNSQRRRASAWIGHLDALAEQARAKQQCAAERREYRSKHPRKKQPRHVRIAQPLKPLNPYRR